MGTYDENMLEIWKQYQDEESPDPTDLRDMGAWARKHGLWSPRPIDVDTSFARDWPTCFASKCERTKMAASIARSFLLLEKAETVYRCLSGPTSTLRRERTLKREFKANAVKSPMTVLPLQ